MLKTSKTVSITGQSMIGDTQVASFNANLTNDGDINMLTQSIINQDQYAANKTQARKDFSDFQNYVYDQSDSMATEAAKDTTDTGTTA